MLTSPAASQDRAALPVASLVLSQTARSVQVTPVTQEVTPVTQEAKHVRRSLLVQGLPLMVILIAQSVLSLRLVWANTAFTDEALYLRSGHLEIQHWLYGTPIPAFPTYFSGSPVIYPPIGALADSIGGLAAARILSLCFMLAATSFLWATARRLHAGRAAFFAAALFAVLGPTVRLGAFATYDAMSLCLVGLAAWCAVRAGEQRRSCGWLAGAALALALANAAKYASALFDPVIFAILVLQARQVGTWKQAVFRGLTQVGYTVGILVFLLALGGSEYITGVEQTTVARASSTSPPSQVFGTAWQLTAVVAVVAATGAALVLIDTWQSVPRRLLVVLLGCTILLVPIEQARIETLTSLNKHVDFGAWFAAITAGYAIDLLIHCARFRALRWVVSAALTALLLPAALLGLAQAQAIFKTWPNSAAVVAKLRQVLPETSGPILDDNNRAVPEYYLPLEGSEWYRWSNNSSLRLPDGKSESVPVGQTLDTSVYVSQVHSGYFSVVILSFTSATAFDDRLLPELAANHHYHLVAAVPYGGHNSQIWEYEPQRRFERDGLAPRNNAGASPLGGLLTPAARLRPILGTITGIVSISGLAVLLLTIVIRVMWRRGKESYEV
jgi:4-amino-4-deoxy-L-arabinose transferase-like glycosyltransferase